ncbi:DUF1003 domain-containing protein [Deinococcus sp.]|uniref:DUF1003 domain-containing protein n=1 Tax=Deinococcus sp. TaxID=47478 RepID=UPI003C7B8500
MSLPGAAPAAQGHDERVAQLLLENSAVNDLLRQQAEAQISNLHRPIERFGGLLSRPAFIVGALCLFLLWVAVNLDLQLTGRRPWDAPPFFWLQGLVTTIGLIVTTTVLVSQARQAQLAEQRAQLQLQFVVLIEQRGAKTIELLEELRRDLPGVHDRVDEQAEVMQHPTRPEAILEALDPQGGAPNIGLGRPE